MISGRGARVTDGTDLVRFLDASGAAYLDTQESRGLVPADHPAGVGSARSAVMRDCDLLITVGRQLDYQLGFGSPAVFRNATVVRIADTASELIDNRRGEVEILADPAAALDALATALADHEPRHELARRAARQAREALRRVPDRAGRVARRAPTGCTPTRSSRRSTPWTGRHSTSARRS